MHSIGKYRIREKIFQSPTESWYRVDREADGRPFVLKTTDTDYPAPADIARFRREFEIAGKLDVPNILKPLDFEESEKGPVLVFEDFDGLFLKNTPASRMKLQQFLDVAVSLARTVHDLHRNGIIHKDINPYNVLLDAESNAIRLTGFGIASESSGDHPGADRTGVIEGSLAYIAPEQTGRMNRRVDHRSDLYSLGATLYEALTGKPPFAGSDPVELVHSHLAKAPVPLDRLNPSVPAAVSGIVMKLLAKTPEERYQSALGLGADLDECRSQLKISGAVERFPLGRYDVPETFRVPNRLYGRKREAERLLESLDQAAEGRVRIVLLSGHAGIGKTSLVQEVFSSTAPDGAAKVGRLITGKYDQFHRNIPYSALVNALQDLARQLLTESRQDLLRWRKRILKALGPNGRIITDVIPEIETVIGPQPKAPELGPVEAKNRFRMVFLDFIRVFCRQERPLFVFLDDLHWIDAATLRLIERIATDRTVRHMLLIGAYRDNEIHPNHPLSKMLSNLKAKNARIGEIRLGPLGAGDVSDLLADALHANPEDVAPLAETAVWKTDGNPFFLNRFLENLYERKLFEFNAVEGRWQWDLGRIQDSETTDNVIDLMVEKIRSLPPETRDVLKLAACIGSRFDLKTLAVVTKQTRPEALNGLQAPLNEGLIVPEADYDLSAFSSSGPDADPETDRSNPVFKFRHDRIQQAAYWLIRGRHKKEVHLKIGRLMLENMGNEELREKIFNVVHHLNFAGDLISNEDERVTSARLNLTAGIKAKASAAYDPALRYLAAGIRFLGDEAWESRYELMFDLHRHRAEAEYLNGNFGRSEKLVALTLGKAKTSVEKAQVYRMLIVQYTLQADYEEAYDVGRKALKLFDIEIPDKDEPGIQILLNRQVKEIDGKIGERAVSDLIHAPESTDSDIKAAMKLLSDMLPLGFFLDLNLFSYLTTELVLLSLDHGYVPDCSYGFACYGRFLITRGEYETGYEFGLLGMRLAEKYNDPSLRVRCNNSFANFVQLWRRHIREANTLNEEAYRVGLQSGELQFAGYSVCNILFNLLYQGGNLERLANLCTEYETFVLGTRNRISGGGVTAVRWTVANLVDPHAGELGSLEGLLSPDGHPDENPQVRDSLMIACHYRIYSAQLHYLYGRPEQALQSIREASEILDYVIGSVIAAQHNFYYSLILAELCRGASKEEAASYFEIIERNQARMKTWGEICPDNFQHKYLLVAAEACSLAGEDSEAAVGYDRAIETARKNGFIQDEALACELAARHSQQLQEEDAAESYLRKALSAYRKWGAGGKAAHLQGKYPNLLNRPDVPGWTRRETSSDALDLRAIMKASQAVSGEIVLEKLLSKLTRILIETAGARRGLLILNAGDALSGEILTIEAEGDVEREEVEVLRSIPLEKGADICSGIVKYVARTREYVVLSDTVREGTFAGDFQSGGRDVKSVVCGPILLKSNLIGIFYLENDLITGAFTPERLEVLKLLAAPMAISIENAKLYSNLEAQAEEVRAANRKLNFEIAERKRAEEKYRSIFENALEGIFQATPEGRFVSANPAFARIFGYASPEELMKSVTDIGGQLYVDPDCRAELNRMLLERRESVSGFETKMLRKDGTALWASIHARPVFDEKGEYCLIEGILADISEKRREAQALREREEYLRKENIRLRSNIRDRYKFGSIIGKSAAMQGVYDLILKAAATEVNVIVYGESGTGKELVARAVHDLSDRRGKSFVTINCGAIPENLLESEFFGYKRGAFTGAYADKPGHLELADGGTLFLDELGEISLNMQVKLLRVLEGKGYMPVGGSQVKKADVRIIAATHRTLQERVKKGLLREDFFYRIHIIPIYLPPLRERREDIPLLIEHFQKTFRYDRKPQVIPGRIVEAMQNYDWPGNVRELQNTLQRYLMLGKLDFTGAGTPADSPDGTDRCLP